MTARRQIFLAVALALLGITGFLLQMRRAVSDVPLASGFEAFPVVLDGWSEAGVVSDDGLPRDLQSPKSLVRAFRKGTTTLRVSIGYYARRPPSSDLVLPSRGWGTMERRVVIISLDERSGRSLRANLLVLQSGDRRTTILYWYQIGARSIYSDYWYRAVLLWNRVVHGRAESALVRIVSLLDRSVDPAMTLTAQEEFVRAFYPELVRVLPD